MSKGAPGRPHGPTQRDFCELHCDPRAPRGFSTSWSPPLPMSGGLAYFAGQPEKFSSQFSPAFFKSGRGGGAERRQWRKKRGGSPVSKGVEGSRLGGDAQRPLGTAGAERRQWRKKRGGSPVSKGVAGSRLGGDAQRPLGTAEGGGQPPAQSPWQGAENLRRYEAGFLCRAATR